MRLGVNLGYWGAGNDAENLHLAREADTLGYAVAWAAEAYGSDAATVLAWVAAQTTQIDVGSAIFQIPGRTPALTAKEVTILAFTAFEKSITPFHSLRVSTPLNPEGGVAGAAASES